MSDDDQRTAAQLRAAVRAEAGPPDADLAGRLLTGTDRKARARRSRLLAAAGATAGVLAVGGWGAASWTGTSQDGLIAGPGGGTDAAPGVVPQRDGAVTAEQAAREGLDGRPQCDSPAVRGLLGAVAAGEAPPSPVAGFLTDSAGYETWLAEYEGSRGGQGNPALFPPGPVVVCWFEGDIPFDQASAGGGLDSPHFALIAVGLAGEPRPGVYTVSKGPVPIVAPPLPAPGTLPAGAQNQQRVVFPQYPGIRIVGAATAAEPPPSPSPAASRPPAVLPDSYVAATETALRRQATDGSGGTLLAEYAGRQPDGSEPRPFLAGVEVSPDGTVYADVCCEPAAGATEKIPDAGGRPDRAFVSAYAPAVSPDGRTLAAISLQFLTLTDTTTGQTTNTFQPREGGPLPDLGAVAWSPDGTLLAVQQTPGPPEDPGASRIVLIDVRTATTLEGPVLEAGDGQSFVAPAFRGDGMLVVARQDRDDASATPATGVVLDPRDGRVVSEFPLAGRVVDQDYDPSGTYLLTVYADGAVRWQGAGQDGTLVADSAVAAAW